MMCECHERRDSREPLRAPSPSAIVVGYPSWERDAVRTKKADRSFKESGTRSRTRGE